jgi:DNA-binding NarL/FixJ family response regulator
VGGLESAIGCYHRNECPKTSQGGAPDATNPTRVIIVNSHPITRMGLAHLIKSQPGLVICDEAGDAAEALETLKKNGPNLVVSELGLPDKSGLELIKDIKAMRPGVPVLVISMHDESLYAECALHAGARGYIMKDASGEELMHAIRQVLSGKMYVSEKISSMFWKLFRVGARRHRGACRSSNSAIANSKCLN